MICSFVTPETRGRGWKTQTESESGRDRRAEGGGETVEGGSVSESKKWKNKTKKTKWGCVASASRCITSHSPRRCVCLWRACMRLWSPRTCRLSAAGCGSQLSGELREREEARWKEGQRQTGTGASARSLQMNGDKSARAIDPLVKAPLRLQPNVLKKETSAPVGALGERQPSSDETHPPHNMESINRQSWWRWSFNTFTSIKDKIIRRIIFSETKFIKWSGWIQITDYLNALFNFFFFFFILSICISKHVQLLKTSSQPKEAKVSFRSWHTLFQDN